MMRPTKHGPSHGRTGMEHPSCFTRFHFRARLPTCASQDQKTSFATSVILCDCVYQYTPHFVGIVPVHHSSCLATLKRHTLKVATYAGHYCSSGCFSLCSVAVFRRWPRLMWHTYVGNDRSQSVERALNQRQHTWPARLLFSFFHLLCAAHASAGRIACFDVHEHVVPAHAPPAPRCPGTQDDEIYLGSEMWLIIRTPHHFEEGSKFDPRT